MKQKGNGSDLPTLLAGTEEDQTHSEKLTRYAAAKRHQVAISSHIVQHHPDLCKVSKSLQACGSFLIFRNFFTVQQYRLIAGCTCKQHLLCALCAVRRSAKLAQEMTKKIKIAMQENSQIIPIMITLTVKNGLDLEERYLHLSKSASKLLRKRRNALSGRRTKTVFSLLQGGIGSYEFKRGSGSTGWHPHPHMIALVDASVDLRDMQDRLSAEWLQITGDSFIVDVRQIKADDDEQLFKSVCEVAKYALKMNELSFDDQVAAYKVLTGRRLVFSFGCLWGLQIPDELDSIEDELALLPYIDMIYRFSGVAYYHSETTNLGPLSYSNKKPTTTKARDRKLKRSGSGAVLYTKKEVQAWVDNIELEEAVR